MWVYSIWPKVKHKLVKRPSHADKFEGRQTASGEKYKHSKLTAAHKTLPFGTIVKVYKSEQRIKCRSNYK
ncbi:MAG: septal ring lytic transglycosylase RlpA family protein [Cytophagales bacterium]|nr:septal ring lytic transglycosylase RlpA family protein [Cytophagales bacterium]